MRECNNSLIIINSEKNKLYMLTTPYVLLINGDKIINIAKITISKKHGTVKIWYTNDTPTSELYFRSIEKIYFN